MRIRASNARYVAFLAIFMLGAFAAGRECGLSVPKPPAPHEAGQ